MLWFGSVISATSAANKLSGIWLSHRMSRNGFKAMAGLRARVQRFTNQRAYVCHYIAELVCCNFCKRLFLRPRGVGLIATQTSNITHHTSPYAQSNQKTVP